MPWPPPHAHSGGPLSSSAEHRTVPAVHQAGVPTHAFPVVWVILTPSSPQGTGHAQRDPGWLDSGWPAEPLGQQQHAWLWDGKHSLSLETSRPDLALNTKMSVPAPEPLPRPLNTGWRRTPAASPPSSSQSPKDLAQGGGTETADWTPLPRADPRPLLHGGEGVGEAFSRAGPAHPHPREPSSPARAGPLTCAETPSPARARPGARSLRGRPAGGCARPSQVGRPGLRLWASDLAPRRWLRGPGDNEAAGP